MTHPLTGLRSEIDEVDRQLLVLLARRFEVVTRVAALKDAAGLPARIGERIIEVIGSREEGGLALGMPSGAAAAIWSAIVEQSCRHEERLMQSAAVERQLST